MAKRAAPQAGASAKRAKVDPMVAGVMKAIDGAQGINDECKALLISACPLSLGVPANERHEAQKHVVSMVGEVLAGSAEELEETVRLAASKIVDLETKKTELSEALRAAEAAAKNADEALETKCQEAEIASVAASEADEVHRQCLQAQQEGDEPALALQKEKLRLESAMEQHLRPVQLEDLQQDVAKKHAQALRSITQGLSLDEALLVSLPTACAKPKASRGAFDVMVVDALAEALSKAVASLSEKLEAEEAGTEARAAAVAEAARAVEDKAEAQQQRNAALQAALAAQKECQVPVQEAEAAELAVEVEIEKAEKERGLAEAALENFQAWPLECFNTLKDKASVAEVAEVAGA